MATLHLKRVEFGDFQTPLALARAVCRVVAEYGFRPTSILEPTCGTGAFIQAAIEAFPSASRILGYEINERYAALARSAVGARPTSASVEIHEADCFSTDWKEVVSTLPEPLLILGNPPWVTNSDLGLLKSTNVPEKSNINRLRGIDALTGSSNFDISEWMLRKSIEWLARRNGMLAVLCKTSVARKVLSLAWETGIPIQSASTYRVDAAKHFAAAVDACLLMIRTGPTQTSRECAEYESLTTETPMSRFGFRDGRLVANVELYEKWRHLGSLGLGGWRSGVKHDCSKVFELTQDGSRFVNGLGECVAVESTVTYPLLKSSDLARQRQPRRWLLVPQRTMSDDPSRLQQEAPRAWEYLVGHAELLNRRASSIYKDRPRFSIFGVGPYSFAPWKVAISGLYKKLTFTRVGPFEGRPVLLDDTCYFFPCQSEEECRLLYELVQCEPAQGYWSAFLFWDSKRPVTASLLNSLDLAILGETIGKSGAVLRTLAERQIVDYGENAQQLLLIREEPSSYGSER